MARRAGRVALLAGEDGSEVVGVPRAPDPPSVGDGTALQLALARDDVDAVGVDDRRAARTGRPLRIGERRVHRLPPDLFAVGHRESAERLLAVLVVEGEELPGGDDR